jgi:Lrp/AsnC family transcriptional regulator, regulator for asnA, asnC and gidA
VNGIDRLDVAILAQLQDDGRRSFTRIARQLGVSVGTVRNRVARLKRDGTLHVIGRADPHRVGLTTPANVHLAIRPPHRLAEAAEAVARMPEVSYVAILTGEMNLELDVMCRDLDHLTEVVTRLHAVPGVADTRVDVVLDVVKYGQPDLGLVGPDGRGDEEETL